MLQVVDGEDAFIQGLCSVCHIKYGLGRYLLEWYCVKLGDVVSQDFAFFARPLFFEDIDRERSGEPVMIEVSSTKRALANDTKAYLAMDIMRWSQHSSKLKQTLIVFAFCNNGRETTSHHLGTVIPLFDESQSALKCGNSCLAATWRGHSYEQAGRKLRLAQCGYPLLDQQ